MRPKRFVPLVALSGVIGFGGLPCHWQAAASTAGAQGAADVHEIHVSLDEWSLAPAQLTLRAGVPVHLVATNNGVLAHALAIEGDGFYAETDAIGSHQSTGLDLSLLAGIYDIYCPVAAGQHRLLGQDGKLEAVDDPTAGADESSLASVAPEEPAPLASPVES